MKVRFVPHLRKRLARVTVITGSVLTLMATAQAVPLDPPNRGAPGRSSTIRTAGSRGCGIIALEPTQTHWGETTQPQPTFWVFLSEVGRTINLSLAPEGSDEVLYTATYAEIPQVGVSRLAVPEGMPALEPDVPYRWTLSVDCPDESGEDPATTGVVVRRSPSDELSQQLADADTEERINLLASHGFWYDTLTEVGDWRLRDPQSDDAFIAWASLLEHEVVQLDDVVNQPLTDCCQSDIDFEL
ncbi:DUF928 domain-containing protein [Oscillatoria sp. CS-180]|uniref:DUF928 domain-containing protein n=1 Tax=Oscillatoria sp. CS-180 TaxID=3021720 RepID=UPI00232F5D4B|nr:DUF928 domain-containing protein [Oscillatoria sp. CS-180]MDB9524542.1 DUF928 domain-containing protein [Oscillatoria sp. CS-180]